MNLYRPPFALIVSAVALSSFTMAQPLAWQDGDRNNQKQADQERSAHERMQAHPQFVQVDDFFGSTADGFGAGSTTIEDALVDARSGRVVAVVFESGMVSKYDRLNWNRSTEGFVRMTDADYQKRYGHAQGEQDPNRMGGVTEAGAKRSDDMHSKRKGIDLDRTYMLSSLLELPIHGIERDDEGRRTRADLGSVGGAFIDARSGHVAYVTTSVGGILGIGAESRVIPWNAFDLRTDEEGDYVLSSSITAERLDQAPTYGEGPDNLDNGLYRDTLYSYYGTKRADFEPETSDKLSLVPLDDLMGSDIARRDGNTEDAIEDLVIDPQSGQAPLAISEGGDVIALSALKWDPRERHFREEGQTDDSMQQLAKSKEMILASTLSDFEVICDGKSEGAVEDVYMDTRSGKIAYIAVNYDGVRVLPWSVVTLRNSGDTQQVVLNCTSSALKGAPEMDGKIGSSIYHPDFRRKVDSVERK